MYKRDNIFAKETIYALKETNTDYKSPCHFSGAHRRMTDSSKKTCTKETIYALKETYTDYKSPCHFSSAHWRMRHSYTEGDEYRLQEPLSLFECSLAND